MKDAVERTSPAVVMFENVTPIADQRKDSYGNKMPPAVEVRTGQKFNYCFDTKIQTLVQYVDSNHCIRLKFYLLIIDNAIQGINYVLYNQLQYCILYTLYNLFKLQYPSGIDCRSQQPWVCFPIFKTGCQKLPVDTAEKPCLRPW